MQLKDLATIAAGYPFRGAIPPVKGAAVLAVQMKDATPGQGIDWATCTPTELPGKREPAWLQAGDILVAARGDTNYAVVVGAPPAGFQAVAAPHFYVLRSQKAGLLPAFLAWLINQQPSQRYLAQHAEGSVTKSIRRSVLESLPVVLPPMAKQQAIVALADTLQAQKTAYEQLIRNGQQTQQAMACHLLNEDVDNG